VIDASGKRKLILCLEWGFWVALAVAAYWLTFDFDEPLDIYRFGASGWPRFILACIVVGATLQTASGLLKERRGAREPVPEDEAATTPEGEPEAPERLRPSPLLLGIFALPLIYLVLLPRTGFFVTTPVFVMAFLWVLQVRRVRLLIGVTAAAYCLVLLIFVRLFYVALPVGNWPIFYDANNWIVIAVRGLFAGG
jgi:Tripartite tricarboxylate transporter TctB family